MDTVKPYPDESFIDLDDGKSMDRIGRADKAVSCDGVACKRANANIEILNVIRL